MTKKLMMMVAAVVAAVGARADTWTDPDTGYTWNYIDGGAEIAAKNWPGHLNECAVSPVPTGAISIPDFLNNTFVSRIGKRAFLNCSGLTSVMIPKYVEEIGDSAFRGCSGLTSVNIPNSVTRIGNGAFHLCTSLVSVDLPIRFKNRLDSSVFDSPNPEFTYWCSVNFNSNGGRVSPYNGTVKYGDELGTFPAVKRDRYVFLGWYTQANGGRKISPPIKITSDCTFYAHWTNEPEFTITNGVLTAVELNYATNVVIPAGVKSIGYQAFSAYSVCFGLTDLKSVTIPNGVTNIASMAFNGCTGLTKVTIPDSVIDIGIGAFTYCDNLCFDTTTIPGVKLMDGWVIDSSWYNISGHLDLTGVRGIGGGAFSGSSKLSSVMIPGSVKSVCGAAFDSCSGLTSLTLGSGVTYIGAAAFANCSNLTTVRIPSSVTRLGRYAFRACSNLTSAILPTQIEWDETVFIGCPKVTIDRKNVFVSAHTVDFDANGGSVSASSRRVGSGAPIGELPTPTRSGYTFAGWWTSSSGGTQVLESTTIFGDIKLYAHWNVVSYTVRFNANGGNGGTTLTVASGAVLGELPTPTRNGYVFTGWFTDVRGGTQVSASTIVTENVQFYAHWWNGVDYTVIFDANGGDGGESRIVSGGSAVGTLPTPTHSGFTFAGWFTAASGGSRVSELTEITDNVRFYAHWQCFVKDPESAAEFTVENGVLTAVKPNGEISVTIPDEVTSIGDGAFEHCCGLTSVTIPNSVTNIGVDAFRGCSGLTNVFVGNGVTSIGRCAFLGCRGLVSVTIPDRVTSIGDSAFLGCRGLVSVTIPDSVTSIEPSAFSGCSGLTSVTIPDSVTSIGYGAFRGCSGLTSLTIPDSVTSIGGSAFYGCSGLTSVSLPGRLAGNLNSSVFAGCSNVEISYRDTSVVTLDATGGSVSTTSIIVLIGSKVGELPTPTRDSDVFKGWYTAASGGVPISSDTVVKRDVTLYAHWGIKGTDSGVEFRIENGVLKDVNLNGSSKVTIPNTVTSIESYAFYGCSGLTSVTIPNSVTNIGNSAFSGCSGLTSVTIPNSVTNIGDNTFYNCNSLTSVTIPDSVTSIGDNAFGNCNSLTSVTVPNSVTKIGTLAFYGCKGLTSVYVSFGDADRVKGLMKSRVFDVTKVSFIELGAVRVAFDANGGNVAEQSRKVAADGPVGELPKPKRTGYIFSGWWTAAEGGIQVDPLYVVNSSVTFYAHWISERVVQAQMCEKAFSDSGTVELDANDNIVVTLTGDVSGTVEIPDNVGAVTIDLNGHNMAGNGGLGETALPDGPAIRIVKGDGEGDTTRLTIVDTSDGEKGRIAGGGESVGIEVSEDAATGVKLDVEEDVGVFNGDGSEQELKPKLIGTGKVTTPKTWKVGQKVTWKATADKGSVFAHWEGPLVDSLDLAKNERRNPSLAFVVPEGFATNMVTAVFIPIDDDGLYTLGITQTEFELNGQSQNSAAGGHAGRVTLPDVLLEKGMATNLWVTDDSQSYVTASASGLPAGLKFNAKTLQITGTPTKSGVFWVQIKAKNASGYQWAENVKVTVSGDGKEAKEPKLTRTAYHPFTVICATEGGTVSGTGVYAEGKKVTIKATPTKGYVFAGWYGKANSEEGIANSAGADYRSPSMSVAVPEMRYVFAKFATKEEDAASLALAVEDATTEKDGTLELDLGACVDSLSLPKLMVTGLPAGLKYNAKALKVSGKATKPGVYTVTVKATNASVTKATDATTATFKITVPNFECAALPGLKPETDAYGTIHAGVKFGPGLIDCTPADGWTVKASGLPAGLKFAAKETKDATYGVVPAWTIYGVPTAKAGAYTVTFTASKKGEKNQVATITLNVEALPAWAVGNFEGFVSLDENDGGFATMSITAAGKISGKISYGGTNWTFKADSFAVASETVGYTNLAIRTVATSGKATLDLSLNMVDFLVDSLPSSTTSFAEGYFGEVYTMMYRLPWKDKNDADAASLIASYAGAYSCKVPYGEDAGDVAFVLDEKGAVKGTVVLPDGDKTRKATFSCNVLPNYDSLSVVIALPPDAKKGYPAVFKVVNLVNHSGEGADDLAFRDPGVVASVAELTAESGATGTVSVNPKYGQVAPGKDVTLTAKAAKGSVFHRWEITGVDTEGLDLSSATLKFKMTDAGDVFAKAVFATMQEDAASLALDLADAITETDGTFSLDLGACVSSLSLAKLTVAGLPTGLKYDAKTMTISGKATKPGLYTVKVTATNASVTGKNAVVGQFTIEVPNFTVANGYFVDNLDNGIGKKRVLSVGITNIDDFLPSLALNSETAKLAVSGLPSGLKYDATNGKITGVATKPGTYTVTLTVTDGKAKYVSTITIEVEALPDWVVGTFNGYIDGSESYAGDWVDWVTITITSSGKVSYKDITEDGSIYIVNPKDITFKQNESGDYIIETDQRGIDWYDKKELRISFVIIDGVTVGVIEGESNGADIEDGGAWIEPSIGEFYAIQNVWKNAQGTKLAPTFIKNTITYVSMSRMRDDDWDPYYGGYLTLKYGANGAVTTAYSETEGGKATATGSAQLVPYEVDGNTTKAWLYTALKPKGRDSFGVLLFLSIDTSNGNIYGDDVVVDDYFLEVDD